ncbi:hypothetical protein SAMN05421759_10855 [Roseivivax lentus]|uniref:DUF6782 domain-containing protein n=1 Tax=Roseivivax lentus TaxID=633194 RepID=A0A1N7NGA5_9RHOB|nr:DUF6782 family putative metallopeptidase [Roseivivax lentus]SIS97209.1 hypothetical protein SAMN05421759_10855 [Roseivivax lentus]
MLSLARASALALTCAAPFAAQPLSCASAPFTDLPGVTQALDALAPALDEYAALRRTLDDTVAAICLRDGPGEAQGYFEPETRRIVLSDGLETPLMMAVLVHELRHAAQYESAVCPDRALAMGDYAQAVAAMEADASVTSLVIADALARAGAPAMWQALADWPMQADIAAAFAEARAAGADLAGAASLAFDAWYLAPDRVSTYYVAACSDYLDAADRDHLLPRYGSLSEGYFTALCHLPDGTRYSCAPPSAPER